MKRILQEMLQDNEVQKMLKEKNIDFDKLSSHLEKINQKVLYKWDLHGCDHSDKVSLFVYLIANKYGVSETELQILLDAAAYHDIGRTSDMEDEIHGFTSSLKVEKVVDNEIYSDKKNLCYLKALCDAHSVSESRIESIYNNYCNDYPEIDFDYEQFIKLVQILRDADALDKTRLDNNFEESLQINYLKLNYSKALISFASELNKKYKLRICDRDYQKIYEQYFASDMQNNKDCLHGIGFNFFKIGSILKHGILSQYAAHKEGVSIHRNFNGNNKGLWISVVDPDMIDKNAKGYNSFVLQGVNFYCFCPKIFSGTNQNSSTIPKYTGEYEDEKFVFDKILPEQIYAILIPKAMTNKTLLEVDYIYGSNNYQLIWETVNDYIMHIETTSNIRVDRKEFNELLQKQKDLVISYESLHPNEQKQQYEKFVCSMDLIKVQINKLLAKIVSQYYADALSIREDQLAVKDVVAFELVKAGVNIKHVYDSEEVLIVLEPPVYELSLEKGTKKQY